MGKGPQCFELHERIRHPHYSVQTEEDYVNPAKQFCLQAARGSVDFRHSRGMEEAQVKRFLTELATEKQVAAATNLNCPSSYLG